jgi:nicotinamide-nucleotide amidase
MIFVIELTHSERSGGGHIMTTAEILVNKLIEKNYHISLAESCTGGMATAAIVDVANASQVLDASIVTYANEAKTKYLGVSPDTISEYGVVSEEVASEMCTGIAKAQSCEVGVGITGVAGPTGGTEAKPVGMVCFGFYVCGDVYTYTCKFGNIGRNEVRKKSVKFVFDKLLELL